MGQTTKLTVEPTSLLQQMVQSALLLCDLAFDGERLAEEPHQRLLLALVVRVVGASVLPARDGRRG